MIVAGIGCRKRCPAEAIVALVREAGAVDMLAAPYWKQEEIGLLEAAKFLDLELRFIPDQALAASQDRCVTRSLVAARTVGFASVAEAAALAVGLTLLRARFANQWATCALALLPPPLREGAGGRGGGEFDSATKQQSNRQERPSPPLTPSTWGGGFSLP